jgi:ribose 5-phosphate isomerase B
MTVYIATDHAGLALKNYSKDYLIDQGYDVVDLGPENTKRVDYPDYADKVCQAVLNNNNAYGILICGTGIGMSMAANKHNGIRAGLCHDSYTATMARQHNNANVLCFGERVVGYGVAQSIMDAWNGANFEGGRHSGRIEKINNIEKK